MEIQWDNTISLGQIGTLGAFLLAGGAVLMRMHAAVVTMKIGLKALDERQAKTEEELMKQTEILITLARVDEWRTSMERRMAQVESHDLRVTETQRRRALEQIVESEARVKGT